MRVLLVLAIALGLVVGGVPADAGKKHRRHHPTKLIWVDMTNHRWSPATSQIQVVNHSNYTLDEVILALQWWELPGVPTATITQADPTACKDIRPMQNVIVLCVGPDNEAGAGWVRQYTKWKHKAKGNRKRTRYIHAAVVWLVAPKPEWSPHDRRIIIAHEFGHTLGIPHLECRRCLMTPSPYGITALAPEDIAALRRLYP